MSSRKAANLLIENLSSFLGTSKPSKPSKSIHPSLPLKRPSEGPSNEPKERKRPLSGYQYFVHKHSRDKDFLDLISPTRPIMTILASEWLRLPKKEQEKYKAEALEKFKSTQTQTTKAKDIVKEVRDKEGVKGVKRNSQARELFQVINMPLLNSNISEALKISESIWYSLSETQKRFYVFLHNKLDSFHSRSPFYRACLYSYLSGNSNDKSENDLTQDRLKEWNLCCGANKEVYVLEFSARKYQKLGLNESFTRTELFDYVTKEYISLCCKYPSLNLSELWVKLEENLPGKFKKEAMNFENATFKSGGWKEQIDNLPQFKTKTNENNEKSNSLGLFTSLSQYYYFFYYSQEKEKFVNAINSRYQNDASEFDQKTYFKYREGFSAKIALTEAFNKLNEARSENEKNSL